MPNPEGSFTAKLVNFQPDAIELRMCENGIFLAPVKYILVCYAPALAVLGHMIHYRVS